MSGTAQSAAKRVLEAVAAGDRRALGRACRSLEESSSSELRNALYASSERPLPWVIGVTGPPGVGKSSLVSRLLEHFREAHDRVAVVAVDPTSPFSGGALLGDRIRMQAHAADDGVFIRSLASRGMLGGLARAAYDLLALMGVWGASVVLLETVGVGQGEHDVMLLADSTLLATAPGLGDELQANKAGIMEVADVFVVNKADLPGAARMVSAIQAAIALSADATPKLSHAGHGISKAAGAKVGDAFIPEVVACSAQSGQGVELVEAALRRHASWLRSAAGEARRKERRLQGARRALGVALLDELQARYGEELAKWTQRVVQDGVDPRRAAAGLLAQLGCSSDIEPED